MVSYGNATWIERVIIVRMIQISELMLSSRDADKALARMGDGRAFPTDNGEISDSMARTIAGWYQSPGSVGSMLAALASGCRVEFDALYEDIAATGRAHNWPVELEYMATWALNHFTREDN